MTEYIRITKWPAEHAQDAYEKGFYIEALQTLHGWMEVKLRELLQLQCVGKESHKNENESAKAWKMTHELSLNQISKALYITGDLPESTLNKILSFNRIRNNLTHKLFYDPYEKDYDGILKEEYDAAFEDGINLGYEIENMSADIIS